MIAAAAAAGLQPFWHMGAFVYLYGWPRARRMALLPWTTLFA